MPDPLPACHGRLALLLGLLAGGAQLLLVLPARAQDQPQTQPISTIVVREQLNCQWTNELLSQTVEVPAGRWPIGGVALTGPDQPQALQLSAVERWPDGSLKRGTLWLLVERLEPLTEHRYEFNPGPPQAQSDLRLTETGDQLEAVTSHFAARLLLGAKTYDQPVAADSVPGPIAALGQGADAWFGGSRLYGPVAIRSYQARVIERGPLFVTVQALYAYADDATLTVQMRIHAGGDRLEIDTDVTGGDRDNGWRLHLTPGLDDLTLEFVRKIRAVAGATQIGKSNWKRKAVADFTPGTLLALSPWGDWFQETSQSEFYLRLDDGTQLDDTQQELVVRRRDPGLWVEPGPPQTFGWNPRYLGKTIPLIKDDQEHLFLQVNNASGQRRFSVGFNADANAKLTHYMNLNGPMIGPMPRLDEVNRMVLDWPEAQPRHPRLFLDAAEFEAALKNNPQTEAGLFNVERLGKLLGARGDIDTLRQVGTTMCLYDAIIDSDLIAPNRRRLFRAQMAYLAYLVASPMNWSAERGYRSGNPNMTVAHIVNQGLLGLLLRDHPMSKTWTDYALKMMDHWLEQDIDASGYWPESSHYGRSAVSKMTYLALAAQHAQVRDYFADEKFRTMGELYQKTLTPPDPMRAGPGGTPGPRVAAPYGRGERGDRWGLGGLLAAGSAAVDPDYAAAMQWSWLGSDRSYSNSADMSGFPQLICAAQRPARAPDWGSQRIPRLGYLLRSGVGSDAENFLLMVGSAPSNPDGETWPSETGAITRWFARGVPISTAFNGYPYDNLHGMLLNRVLPRMSHRPGQESPPAGFIGQANHRAFASLPRADYAHAAFTMVKPWRANPMPRTAPSFPAVDKLGELPIDWQRQLLWVRAEEPGGPAYLILRDTVTGGQPTQWHFWTLSKSLQSSFPAPAAQGPGVPVAGNRDAEPQSAAGVEDEDDLLEVPDTGAEPRSAAGAKGLPAGQAAPADAPRDASPLVGDRFTALGQFGLDLEYFVASPVGTPRHTLRHGQMSAAQGVTGRFPEYQDLLQLTLPGDGAYFVTLFPRRPAEKAPAFTALAGGLVIRIDGDFGRDYVFLSPEPAQAATDQAAFQGSAASIQQRRELVLSLSAPGSVSWAQSTLSSPVPSGLTIAGDRAELALAQPAPDDVQVTVQLPGAWQLAGDSSAVKLAREGMQIRLTIPAGLTRVGLNRDGK